MFEIPEKFKDDTIYITNSKGELIAYSEMDCRLVDGKKTLIRKPWMVKVASCSGCGQCCRECVFITSEGCGFKINIPHKCLVSDCSRDYDQCTERFEEWRGQ